MLSVVLAEVLVSVRSTPLAAVVNVATPGPVIENVAMCPLPSLILAEMRLPGGDVPNWLSAARNLDRFKKVVF